MELQVVLFENTRPDPFDKSVVREGLCKSGPDFQRLDKTLVVIPTWCTIECVGMEALENHWKAFRTWRIVRRAAYIDKYILRVEVFDDPVKDHCLLKTLNEATARFFFGS
jgi:hypothetical protein